MKKVSTRYAQNSIEAQKYSEVLTDNQIQNLPYISLLDTLL